MERILIIEDDRTINGLLRSMIEKSGYAVDCAYNGADDYITKPFDMDEVLLRIQAVLRRSAQQETKKIVFRELAIETDVKRVFVNGVELGCTATEYAILELLMKHLERIFSKRAIYEIVTGEDYLQEDNTMNVHISNLRKKIAKHTEQKYIETVYGMGYRLVR